MICREGDCTTQLSRYNDRPWCSVHQRLHTNWKPKASTPALTPYQLRDVYSPLPTADSTDTSDYERFKRLFGALIGVPRREGRP